MICKNLDDLMDRVMEIDSLSETERNYLRAMLNAYWSAYHNPPAGVVGVGAVSYAESALISFQLNEATK